MPTLTVRNSVVGAGFVRAAAVALVVARVLGVALAAFAIWLGSKFPLICPSWASWFHRSNGSIFSDVGVGIKGGGINGLGMGAGGGAGVFEGVLCGMGAGTVTVRTTVRGAGRGSRRGVGGGAALRVATRRGVLGESTVRGALDGLGDGSGLGFAVFCRFSANSFCWSR